MNNHEISKHMKDIIVRSHGVMNLIRNERIDRDLIYRRMQGICDKANHVFFNVDEESRQKDIACQIRQSFEKDKNSENNQDS